MGWVWGLEGCCGEGQAVGWRSGAGKGTPLQQKTRLGEEIGVPGLAPGKQIPGFP